MTTKDLIQAVKEGTAKDSLAILYTFADFFDLTDPYGIQEYYGDYSKKSVKLKVVEEILFELENEPSVLLERLEFDLNETGNYDFETNSYIN